MTTNENSENTNPTNEMSKDKVSSENEEKKILNEIDMVPKEEKASNETNMISNEEKANTNETTTATNEEKPITNEVEMKKNEEKETENKNETNSTKNEEKEEKAVTNEANKENTNNNNNTTNTTSSANSTTDISSGFELATNDASIINYKGPEISYSLEKNRPKKTEKRKICFQLLDLNKVEIEPNFTLPSEAIYILKQYNAHFSPSSNFYQVTFDDYHKVLNDLEKLCRNEDIKKKLEVKRVYFESIPSLPLEVAEKTRDMSVIQFKTLLNIGNKLKSVYIDLDYTKDEKKSFDSLPTTFTQVLYEFQKEGIIFGMERKGRMLLADEMGVGKTLQAISLAYIYRDSWPVLVVCPGSMKYNWKAEIQTWLGLKDIRINIINR